MMLFYFLLFLFIPISQNFSKITLSGNLPQGFSSEILKNVPIDLINKKFFILTAEKPSGPNGSLFGITLYTDNNTHIPLITPNAIVNNSFHESNPLYGTYFLYSTLAYAKSLSINAKAVLLAVNNVDPNKVYGIYSLSPNFSFNTAMFLTPTLNTSQNNTGEIHAIAPRAGGFSVLVEAPGTSYGDSGSESLIYLYNMTEKILQNTTFSTVEPFASHHITLSPTGDNFAPFGGSINIIPNSISLIGDHGFLTPFIAISGSGSQGICALLNITTPIANPDATETDSIIATTTPDATVYVHSGTILTTSTGLIYLIVQGGIGSSEATNNTIFALPLVNDPSGAKGYCADINEQPTNIFNQSGAIHMYQGTYLSTKASAPGDLYTSTAIPAQVGGGPLQAKSGESFIINSIETHKDTVFALTTYNGSTIGSGGVFYSQALFDEYGAIKSWTPWQRKNLVGDFSYQKYIPYSGSHVFMQGETPHTAFQTTWSLNGPWNITINSKKFNMIGFCQGISAFFYNHPAIGPDTNSFNPSFALYTGYNTIIAQQTSKNNDLIPLAHNSPFITTNGTLQSFDSSDNFDTLLFQGGELNSAGALITSALAYSDNDCWIIAGGNNGVYILANPDGTGCGTNKLTTNFEGLLSTMEWRKIGNFTKVKKIVTQLNTIYILTTQALYQIPINSSAQFARSKKPPTVLLADSNMLKNANGSFSDFIASHSCALLATSEGLYQSYSIDSNALWTKMTMPESNLPCIALYPINNSGNNDEWAFDDSDTLITGNITVLMGSISTHQAKLYRLICYNTNNESYQNNNAIKMLNNYFLENTPTAYFDFLMDRISVVGDGAAWYTHYINSTNISFNGTIELITPFLRTGYSALKNYSRPVFATHANELCGPLCYVPGLGLWLTGLSNGIGGLL